VTGVRVQGWGVRADPRTKLTLLVVFAVATFLAPGWRHEALVMVAAAVLASAWGRWFYAAVMAVIYAAVVAGMMVASGLPANSLTAMVLAFFMLLRKVFPCALLAGAVVSTTRMGEFMTALGRMRVPRSIVVPLAVMLRYVPVVREDWRFISDAMRMRGISPTPLGLLRAPMRTVECVYVPMLMGASNAADELAMASIARGIENPARHTCLVPIRFTVWDVVALALGGLLLVCMAVPGVAA